MSAWFGLRNPSAETFATAAVGKYFDPSFAESLADESGSSCTMRFSFGAREAGWSQSISRLGDPELGARICHVLENHVLPLVRTVTTKTVLFNFLASDATPGGWSWTNGAIRAAQIVALGRSLELRRAEIVAMLLPRLNEIGRGFPRTSPLRDAPSDFIAELLDN
jgi:hypothetical protein